MGKMTTFLASLTDDERRILASMHTTELLARQALADRTQTVPEDLDRLALAFDAMTAVQPIGAKPSDFTRKSGGRVPQPDRSDDPMSDLERGLQDAVAGEKVAA